MNLSDRLGGVVFDIQQYRAYKRANTPLPPTANPARQKLIVIASDFLGVIEEIDERELRFKWSFLEGK